MATVKVAIAASLVVLLTASLLYDAEAREMLGSKRTKPKIDWSTVTPGNSVSKSSTTSTSGPSGNTVVIGSSTTETGETSTIAGATNGNPLQNVAASGSTGTGPGTQSASSSTQPGGTTTQKCSESGTNTVQGTTCT